MSKRTAEEQALKKVVLNCRSERKHLKKKAQAEYPGRPIGWIGAQLFFLDTNVRVAGVKEVPKPEQEVLGLKANHPRGHRDADKTFVASASSGSTYPDDRPYTRILNDSNW